MTVPSMLQDVQQLQQDQPLQCNMQGNAEAVARPEDTEEWQVSVRGPAG